MFGFDNQALTRVRADERQAVRGAVSRMREGSSQAAAAAWMASEGFTGTMGGAWNSMTLGRLLDNPAIAGLERDPDTGELVETGREALITPEEFRWLQQRPGRGGSVRTGEVREDDYDYLFTGGMAECGRCSVAMTGGRTTAGSPSYRCQTSSGGCGKIRISAGPLEDHVGESVLGELARPGAQAALEKARDEAEANVTVLRAEIAKTEGARVELAEPYAKGELSRAAYVAADKATKRQLKDLRAQVRWAEQLAAVPLSGVEDLARWWEHAPARSKQRLTALLIDKIVVLPARARGVRDASERIQLDWRTPSDAS
ncbi:recombinase family protein [Streptomyces sp. NPDC002795]|uniref:recombinase family protein n=1 Tax=Streptomyces sp. NPDC002795 TaxID=3364665 RepID=UPI00367B5D2F